MQHRHNNTMISAQRLLYLVSALYAANQAATAFTPTITTYHSLRRATTAFVGIPSTTRLYSSTPPSSSSSSSSSSKGGKGDTSKDEYDVIVLYPKSEIPFFLQETPDGEAAFAGYVQYDQPCSTIKNVGDVLIAIDGEYVADKPIRQIVQIVQEKARNCAYSFLRFRSTSSSSSSSSSSGSSSGGGATASAGGGEDDDAVALAPGQLPGEKRRTILEKKKLSLEQQVANKKQEIDDLLETKRLKIAELDALDQKDLEWIEQQRLALINPNRNFTNVQSSSSNNNNNNNTQHYAFAQGSGSSSNTKKNNVTVSTDNNAKPKPWNVGGLP